MRGMHANEGKKGAHVREKCRERYNKHGLYRGKLSRRFSLTRMHKFSLSFPHALENPFGRIDQTLAWIWAGKSSS